MKEFKINPINLCGGRRFEYLPPHIETIEIRSNRGIFVFDSKTKIIDWIEENLKGRYFYGTTNKLIDNEIFMCDSIGFEDPYEATLFLLGCPYMAKNNH